MTIILRLMLIYIFLNQVKKFGLNLVSQLPDFSSVACQHVSTAVILKLWWNDNIHAHQNLVVSLVETKQMSLIYPKESWIF